MPGISSPQEQQIRKLIAEGNKIAAIKLYRETAGVSLKDAMEAVEAVALESTVNLPVPVPARNSDPFLENKIKGLLAERKKIEAIRLYRETYHCGLKDAKDAVDRIEVGLRQEQKLHNHTPSTDNDPFAEEAIGNRRRLIISVALILIIVGIFAFFFIFRSAF